MSVLGVDGDRLGHEVDAPSRHDGPQILLCTEGSAVVHAKSGAVTLERGAAAWVSADDGPIRLVAAAVRPSCSVPPSGSETGTGDVDRGQYPGDPGGAAGQCGHRGREVRRLPDHRQLVDAGRVGALGRRHRPTRVCCCSASGRRASEADPLHQFGYGRSRYFYSFVVALVLFTLGSVFALYEGYHKISHPASSDLAASWRSRSWSSRSAWRATAFAPRWWSRGR